MILAGPGIRGCRGAARSEHCETSARSTWGELSERVAAGRRQGCARSASHAATAWSPKCQHPETLMTSSPPQHRAPVVERRGPVRAIAVIAASRRSNPGHAGRWTATGKPARASTAPRRSRDIRRSLPRAAHRHCSLHFRGTMSRPTSSARSTQLEQAASARRGAAGSSSCRFLRASPVGALLPAPPAQGHRAGTTAASYEQLKKAHATSIPSSCGAGTACFWFTTTCWMMWNSSVGLLHQRSGRHRVYDGSPATRTSGPVGPRGAVRHSPAWASAPACCRAPKGRRRAGTRTSTCKRCGAIGSRRRLAPETSAGVYGQRGPRRVAVLTRRARLCAKRRGGCTAAPVGRGASCSAA